jgi:hypothetical protein
MSNEEQQLFLLALEAIEISLNDLEWKARAVEQSLRNYPALYSDYQKSLENSRKGQISVVGQTVASLRQRITRE